MRCRCGSSKVESDPSTGTVYCVGCGEVLEENTMVSEVSFHEMSGGKTVLSGSYAGESGRISSGGPFGGRGGRAGQEQAMENGRQKIARLSFALHLSERFREAAQRYYNLAVVNRFTRGRKSDHVAAVCLYIVCRNEQSSQMLIDFSDLLQVNVFMLGATFLKLVRVLCLKLPLVDPSIYISRFAAALDFGEYTQRVAQDAVRLVQRMDRDWIRTGRRPAGICGACLLIAARVNGFRRTTREMIYIVKVADVTIQKRLKEFNTTDSSNLSVRDFRTMWLETEADPPAFSTPINDANLEKGSGEVASIRAADDEATQVAQSGEDDDATQVEKRVEDEDATQVEIPVEGRDVVKSKKPDNVDANYDIPETSDAVNPDVENDAAELEKELATWMNDKSLMEATEALEVGKQNQDESLSDVDDEEIEAMILTNDEVNAKTIVWYNANKEYLEEMAAKARKQEMDRKNGIFTKKGKSGKRKRPTQANTPAEAAKQLVIQKKLSKKINQAVFDDMF
ncbi:hypothetical protein PHYBLDRAFT_121728, partial [Phycomyces blakesleeanus NRRL 1555(-)]